jgi:hypothetical protein
MGSRQQVVDCRHFSLNIQDKPADCRLPIFFKALSDNWEPPS